MAKTSGFPKFWPAVLLLLIASIAQFILSVVVMIGAATMTSLLQAEKMMQHPAVLGVINLLVFGAASWVGFALARRPVADVFPLRRVSVTVLLLGMLATCGLQILLSDFDNLVRIFCPPPEWLDRLFDSLSSGNTNLWASIFTLSIVAPLTEECLFRGVILQGFRRHYRILPAVLLSSLLFAIIHLNPWQMSGAFLLGLLFGWLTVATGSLLPGICGHATANSLPWLLGLLKLNALLPGLVNQNVGKVIFQPWWLDLGAAVTCAISLLLLRRLLRRPSEVVADTGEAQTLENACGG